MVIAMLAGMLGLGIVINALPGWIRTLWWKRLRERSSASSTPATPKPPPPSNREAHGLVADEIYRVAEGV